MNRLFLIDASSLFFRAFFGVRPLSAPSGLPTNAIYGLLTMTLKLLKEEKNTHLLFCYDRPEPSFRKDLYSDYKANRTEMPSDLSVQIPYIKKLAQILGIPSVEQVGFEADDLIGSYTLKALENDWKVVIVSGDKDFCQLLGPGVQLYDTMKSTRLEADGVVDKYGVRADQFVDYLALVGDSSDHVPGVAGIGPKSAAKLLQDFGTLEGIYENLEKVASKSVAEKLKANHENAFLSKKLVKIATDMPLPIPLEDCVQKPVDEAAWKDLMKELNFKSVALPNSASEIDDSTPKGQAALYADNQTSMNFAASSDYQGKEIKTVEEFQELFHAEKKIWIDVDSAGQFWVQNENAENEDFFAISQDILLAGLSARPLLWQGWDLKSVAHQLPSLVELKVGWDSGLAHYCLNPAEKMDWARAIESHLGESADFSQIHPAKKLQWHRRLQLALLEKTRETTVEKLLLEIDFPLAEILFSMEKRGIALDVVFLKKMSLQLAEELSLAQQQIFAVTKHEFNVASPKQLAQVLFEELKLPPSKKTKTGFSTDSDVLEKLKGQHPIIEMILEFREVAKLKSTYVDAFPEMVKEDARLHTTFHQALTATGRLSSSDPNLQNIPIRTERGERVRRAFVAAPGSVLMSADYSQIELRILAHYSDDPQLAKAFHEGLDIHRATASEVFGVALSEVTSDQRRTAKAINFGIAYGQGAFGLAETLGISRTEAQGIISRYFQKFPGVQNYIQSMIQKATKDGFVETLLGRRRYLEELQSKNPAIRKFGERAAINAPIQGTASDIVKIAMIHLRTEVSIPLILQIHDELIFEGPKDELLQQQKTIEKCMTEAWKLKVPLTVNMGIGSNWHEAHA